jgi:hypothetical protein
MLAQTAAWAGSRLHVLDEVGDHGIGIALVHRAGAVHRQHDLVGVPVGEQVHRRGQAQRDQHAGRPADHIADADEEGGQGRQQDVGLGPVHVRASQR